MFIEMSDPSLDYWPACDVLEMVDDWATEYVLIKEIGSSIIGRFDALLVPYGREAHCMRRSSAFWSRPSVIGVEVKVSRQDFLNGKNKGQYERYMEHVNGLYIATANDICKTNEIPKSIGHLVVKQVPGKWPRIICKRHPKYVNKTIDNELLWRIVFKSGEYFRRKTEQQKNEIKRAKKKIGDLAGKKIFSVLNKIG